MSAPELATIARCVDALSPQHRQEIVRLAVGLVERERRALLPQRERERANLIDRYTRCVDLLEETKNEPDCQSTRIQRGIWRHHAAETKAKLATLGVNYFG